ncbi:MAG: SGNH/GDSL hydrolase family protein [Verrucomicrobia bacterium]|nr:SGNH/GDSL hydrolase family protein [Verrucomicrobiota bacterium]MBT7065342.1 SGNH/GDSL hydrolase family protein [Verrucomicrobiota bacterium]MBT7700401.1 SGNH/GDSL hydrolase family protein [Verrucomicrobiota bacterium]
MILEQNDKLVMIGDSITDCGRGRPAGEGLFDPYGSGYVNMVKAFLDARHPNLAIRVVNKGNSGNTVRELKARWQEDVLDQKPNWLSIMIGINDVWRQFDSPKMPETHVGLKEYERTLEELITASLPGLKGLILVTPYFIEPNRDDPMRARMNAYGAVIKALAEKHNAILVDTQAGFDRMLEHMHPMALAWDRVHPNSSGHGVIATCFLEAINCEASA